jgi:hypothetical protein
MALNIDAGDLANQAVWSHNTFGPGFRSGVFRHLEKELIETEANPDDCSEWVDIIILALDGAMRAGHTPADIIRGYHLKMLANREREWPDWRQFSADEAIEHVR